VQRSARTINLALTQPGDAPVTSTPIRRGNGWPEISPELSLSLIFFQVPLFSPRRESDIAGMLSSLPETGNALLPAVYVSRAQIVEERFWAKLLKLAGRVPFVEDLAAAYFCFVDPTTPGRVRGIVLAALAWFVLPASILPEFIVVLGFTDDVAVVAIAARMVRRHIKQRHYQRAREVLGIPDPVSDDEIWSGY
jgi:uncharacterized membrane protein YkvA (DUF1232 family)